jgi:hypothetical protein
MLVACGLLLGLVRDKRTVLAAAVAERPLASERLTQQSAVSRFMRTRHVQVRATLVGETQRDRRAPTIDAEGEDGPSGSLAVDSIVGGVMRRDALPVSASLRLREVGLIQRSIRNETRESVRPNPGQARPSSARAPLLVLLHLRDELDRP